MASDRIVTGSSRAALAPNPIDELHSQVLAGNDRAVEQIATWLLRVVPPRLRRTFPLTSPDVLEAETLKAVLEYLKNPRLFDSTRGVPLVYFIRDAAKADVLNWIQSEGRRRAREAAYAAEIRRCQTASGAAGCGLVDIDAAGGLLPRLDDRTFFLAWLMADWTEGDDATRRERIVKYLKRRLLRGRRLASTPDVAVAEKDANDGWPSGCSARNPR